MDVRDIAAQLNVDALLEGTIRIEDGRLRVTTQLTGAADGYSIWAASFERDINDKIQLQTEIAAEITRQLVPSLTNDVIHLKGVTANVKAQDFYFLGRYHWHKRTPESLKQAVDYFREAIKLDPEYALAYAGLSDALLFQTAYDNRTIEEVVADARNAVEKAIELEPQLAETQASLGMLFEQTGDLERAREAYGRAIQLNPQNSMAHMWLGNVLREDADKSYYHYEQALKLDPLHPQVQYNYIESLMSLGRFDEAIRAMEQFLKLNPHNLIINTMLEAKLQIGDYDEVLRLAVGYNITDENKPFLNDAVVETLIHLQRFEEAEKMIRRGWETMDPWQYGLLLAKLSVARRDPAGVKEVVEFLASPETRTRKNAIKEHNIYNECIDVMASYLQGIATYLSGDYPGAINQFDTFFNTKSESICYKLHFDTDISALLYQASAYLRSNTGADKAAEILTTAGTRLMDLRHLGWDTPDLALNQVARYSLMNEQDKAVELLREMINRGWKPYGRLRMSPLLDDFRNYLASNKIQLPELENEYQKVMNTCSNIGLAKLGL